MWRVDSPDRGFTLIELLMVVAIIGLLAAIAVPNLLRSRISANEAQAIADTRTVISAEHAYAAENAGYFAPLMNLTWQGGGTIGTWAPSDTGHVRPACRIHGRAQSVFHPGVPDLRSPIR